MTPEEFKQKMQEIYDLDQPGGDHEHTHCLADDLMSDLLRGMGYGGGIDIYNKLTRWYA